MVVYIRPKNSTADSDIEKIVLEYKFNYVELP